MKKPVTINEAPPRPWQILESRGGTLFIYANGEESPIPLIKGKRRPTRRELATLRLVCKAVNAYRGVDP